MDDPAAAFLPVLLLLLAVLNAVLGDPAGWLLRQLVNAFRLPFGVLLLLLIWAGCIAWIWMAMSSLGDPESLFFRMARVSIFAAPALAGFSAVLWRRRSDEQFDTAVQRLASSADAPRR